MRLNAYLALAGLASRRKADELIKAGRVRLNGHVGQLNSQVADGDAVELDGRQVRIDKHRYILLNKPTSYITSLKDEKGRPKVTDLLDITERVVPVGRLDLNTSGLLLLTNDGQLAHRLTHPSFGIDKTYLVDIDTEVTSAILNKLSIGLIIDGRPTVAAKANKHGPRTISLTIHEGRKRQVRRMMSTLGLRVRRLQRVGYGNLKFDGVAGQWRELTTAEVRDLKNLAGMLQ